MNNTTQSSISYQGMRDAVTKIRGYKDEMNNILNNTTSKMNEIESSWKSDAEAKLKSQFDSMAGKFQGFVAAVDSYASFIENAVNAYEAQDKDLEILAGSHLSN